MTRIRPVIDFTDTESRTKQSFQTETDINYIIRRYDRDGVLTHVRDSIPQFMDVSDMPDYRTALEHVVKAQESFEALPAALRAEFNHDPAEYLDFVTGASVEEIRETLEGLLTAASVPGALDPAPEAPEASEPAPELESGN